MTHQLDRDHRTYQEYIQTVVNEKGVVDTEAYSNFKHHPTVNMMYEHVTRDQGTAYLDIILKKWPHLPYSLWKRMLENDNVGNPTKYAYSLPYFGTTRPASPTTLRYIMYALMVADEWMRCINKPSTFVEIGSGYGGFCKVFLEVASHYAFNIQKYIAIEVDASVNLVRTFLKDTYSGSIPYEVYSPLSVPRLDADDTYGYVCSFYCFSELSREVRDYYTHTILDNSDNGMIAWNFLPLSELPSCMFEYALTILPEEPNTGGSTNKVIIWSKSTILD